MKKKKILKSFVDAMPDMLKNAADWMKINFDSHGAQILDNASGSIGLVLKLVGQPLVDTYFNKRTKQKLENFGLETYLKAAYLQAYSSIETIEEEIKSQKTPNEVLDFFKESTLNKFIFFNPSDVLLIFQPIYHPAIILIKDKYIQILKNLDIDIALINTFKEHFNSNIEDKIKYAFGETDYIKHLENIELYLVQENEAKLLWDTFQLRKIGFNSNESLKYEETYGFWKEVGKYKTDDNIKIHSSEIEQNEKELKPVNLLIEDYFQKDEDNINKILFMIADFGKGKSVFMKNYASILAQQYIETKEGFFPIYFNLREYKSSVKGDSLGVINDFLLSKYGIDIRSQNFISKRYIFLIDSLDESGELTKENISKVINSVSQIQNLDKTKYRSNRLVISSRPINEGLEQHLRAYGPYCLKDKTDREIEYFISIYGFKKEQFNNWLYDTINNSTKRPTQIENVQFVKEIYEKIDKNEVFDIHKVLLENKTLGLTELRRPIFAYMIYQLIINSIDFLKVGKIGIYLSFINLLTKDAKHINDPHYIVKLEEEFKFRNVLHATAALWMYESRKGEQAHLKKADLCRVVEGVQNNESDSIVLERNKKNGLIEIEFLSHSYFGEDSGTLHFQHQSFAEILLAEYYLKIFIKYALDKNVNIEEARIKLHLGKPTEQTIRFFIELVSLLKETIETENISFEELLEKRKLLFPLLAALATEKNNTLFSNDLYYLWYKPYCIFNDNQVEYPTEALSNWCINSEHLSKIEHLASQIINSELDYILTKTKEGSSLFDKEVSIPLEKTSQISNSIDKWLSLIVGNYTYNDFTDNLNPKLFNTDYKINFRNLLSLIEKLDSEDKEEWMYQLFKGIYIVGDSQPISLMSDYNHFNFSYATLKNIHFIGAFLGNFNLDYAILEKVSFNGSFLWGLHVDKIKSMSYCNFNDSILDGCFFLKHSYDGEKGRIIRIYIDRSDFLTRPIFDLIEWYKLVKKFENSDVTYMFYPLGIETFIDDLSSLKFENSFEINEYIKHRASSRLNQIYKSE